MTSYSYVAVTVALSHLVFKILMTYFFGLVDILATGGYTAMLTVGLDFQHGASC